MNAYELAKELDEYNADGFPVLIVEQGAEMLRQQADRIDRLEREAVAKNNYLEQHCQKIDQQADRIAELEKQGNLHKNAHHKCVEILQQKQGEPVAWMNGNEICPEIGYEATITIEHLKDLGWIPLYTHPVKELTDELFDKIFADGKRLGVLETEDRFCKAMQLTDEEIDDIWAGCSTGNDVINMHQFAKAILRKAQEK